MSSATFRPDIQGLRGVAVILVILAHANVIGFQGGFVGVDVFFVISGFVITQLLLRQPPTSIWRNLGHFYTRRVLRIVPAATLVLVATTLLAFFLLGDDFDPRTLVDVRWAALFGANFRLIDLNANYFIAGLSPSLITHYWSLAVEEQFYICYPILFFTVARFAPEAKRKAALRMFLLVAIVASAAWSVVFTNTNPVAAYYTPLTRFWELGVGGLVALSPRVFRWAPLNYLVSWVAAAALGASVYFLQPTSIFPGSIAWWPVAATAVLLSVGRSEAGFGFGRLLSLQPLKFIGDISYSLYLWHFGWLVLPTEFAAPPTANWWPAAAIGGAVCCAIASYYLVENPFRHSKRLQQDGFAVAILLAVAIAITWNATLLVEWWSISR